MQDSPSLLDTYPGGNNDVLFSIEMDLDSDVVAMAVHGELDIGSGRRLLSSLEPYTGNGPPSVRVDLGHVSFIDSSGAMAVVELSDWIARQGGVFAVGVCPARVEQIFAWIGIPLPRVLQA